MIAATSDANFGIIAFSGAVFEFEVPMIMLQRHCTSPGIGPRGQAL